MKKNILVTGSSGYIGQHLCALLEKEYNVFGLDYVAERFEKRTAPFNIRNKIKPWWFDFHDMPFQYDVVVHLAALVRVNESVKHPMLYYDTNINGTYNVLKEIPTKNFILASTGAAENPVSPYGISKLAAESLVTNFCTKNKIDYTIFRFYNVIGSEGFEPTNPDGLMYNLIKAKKTGSFDLYGDDYDTPDGTPIRDYVHVLEICRAIKLAIERPSNAGVENLGTGIGYSVQEIVNYFKEANSCDFRVNIKPRRDGDPGATVLKNVSPYMKKYYTIQEILKIK